MSAFLSANALKLAGVGLALMGALCLYLYIDGLILGRRLANCQTQSERLSGALRIQNAAVAEMQRQGEARAAEQREALARANRETEAQRPLIDRLRRAASRPQGPGCATPPELREMGNSL